MMRCVQLASMVTIAALALAGCSSSNRHTLTATVEAPACDGGYNLAGASVLIRNEHNDIIASTTTSQNTLKNPDACQVTFEAAVPKATFYQMTIGTHGAPAYQFTEMQSRNWHVDLSLK